MARSFTSDQSQSEPWTLIVHGSALLPAVVLAIEIITHQLGVDPIGQAIRLSGRYALIMLLVALLPGPLARIAGIKQAMRFRRPLGLYAFGYALLHLMLYAGWDYRFQLGYLAQAILDSPFIWAGLAALVILLALTVTSNRWSMRRLGRRWRWLHRLVLLAGGLATLHYAWVFKELRLWPVLAAAAVTLLALVRVPRIEALLKGWLQS